MEKLGLEEESYYTVKEKSIEKDKRGKLDNRLA